MKAHASDIAVFFHSSLIQNKNSIILLTIIFIFQCISICFGQNYFDSFINGIDTTYWEVISNDTLYTVNASKGDIRFARKEGGTKNLNIIRLRFKPTVYGDFDISVDFSNAYIQRINGSPGNQVQLNTGFGGQAFSVVRSDEASQGQNFHVWIDPPAAWRGAQSNNDASGTLRISRAGTIVTGFFNDDTIFSGSFNDAELSHLSFSLQNNQTIDSTSVTFDNFSVQADSIEDVITGLKEYNSMHSGFELKQNYPNPFNPATTIRYHLPLSNKVKLIVYDILGKTVKILVNEKQSPGSHKIIFKAEDLANGIYFYKLQAGAYINVKRMLLIK